MVSDADCPCSEFSLFIAKDDPREYARWDIQHDALEQAIGLCYQSYLGDLIPQILGPRDGPAPRVVDIGTGSGKWAIEIAKAFPHAEVLGIDYQKPPMDRFEQDDVNLGLEHYANTFDIVHARIVDLGIDDYPGFLYDMAKIMRPGGIIILFKPSMRLFQNLGRDVNGEDVYAPIREFGVKDDPPGYQLQKVICLVDECVKKRGGSEDAWMYYRELLEANPNYETESIKIRWLNVPVCLFPPNIPPEHLWICRLMEENMKRLCDSWTPILLEDGYRAEDIQRWKKLVHEELETKQTKAYSRWTFAVATRKNARWASPPASRASV
ncbi:hypothetical protein FS837_005360 [Tulasnella sp. UAMH 9824]|nr:hypothetical protein FS837_005360 [Tulasnella sp. UAMH 9824]